MLAIIVALAAAVGSGDGVARVVGGRVEGHYDSPDLIEFAGKTFNLHDMDERRDISTLSTFKGGVLREHLIKIEVPAKVSFDQLREIVSNHDVPFARKGWVKHAAKNTISAFCNRLASEEIRDLKGVTWVGEATNEHLRYMKSHKNVLSDKKQKGVDRDNLILTMHDVDYGYLELKEMLPLHIPVSIYDETIVVQCHSECNDISILVAEHHGLVESIFHRSIARGSTKFARGIMQSGASYDDSFSHLQGEGQVIAVADGGIDHDHCFFHDPNVSIPLNNIDKQHRKIVLYKTALVNGTGPDNSTAAQSDYAPGGHGHGTHVAGTIAGTPFDPNDDLSEFQGILPKAKIAFIDLAGEAEIITDDLEIPLNMSKDMFGIAHDAGAYIHSNSWGSAGEVYDKYSRGFDEFAISNPFDLLIAAAGNEGIENCSDDAENPSCDKFTVGTPGDCKNGVGVGASEASTDSFIAAGQGNYVVRFTAVNGTVVSYFALRSELGQPPEVLASGKLAAANPLEACENDTIARIDNPSDMVGRIAVIKRGICFFETKIMGAVDSGATAVIVANNRPGLPISMQTSEVNPIDLPGNSYMINEEGGNELLAAMAASPDMTAAVIDIGDPNAAVRDQNLASFSSRGPTADLRYKPDVVGVGKYIHSARSDSDLTSFNCDTVAMAGTSMATPVISGTTGQIREWLLLTFPTFTVRPPTSALMKAALVQSAIPLVGWVDRNGFGDMIRLGEVPDFYQGHGRPVLASTLVKDEFFFLDSQSFQVSGENKVVCIKVNTSSDTFESYGFRATLAWTDPMAGPGSKWQLVNDLDLTVKDSSGTVRLGNGIGPPVNHAKDANNNVEKVRISKADLNGDIVAVTVSSFSILQPQAFALVASGNEVACPEMPQWNAPIRVITGSRRSRILIEMSESFQVWEWRYYKLPVEVATQLEAISFNLNTTNEDSNPELYLEIGTNPTMRSFTSNWNSTGEYVFDSEPTKDVIIGVMMACCSSGVLGISMSGTWKDQTPPLVYADTPIPIINNNSDDSNSKTIIVIIVLASLIALGIVVFLVLKVRSGTMKNKASFLDGEHTDIIELHFPTPAVSPNFSEPTKVAV